MARPTGVIAWFTRNHVAANLLMLAVAALGYYNLQTQTTLEVFPSFTLDRISVRASYPGATPGDVEESVTVRVEEALSDLDAIDTMRSRSIEGSSAVTLDLIKGADERAVLDDVKARLDTLDDLPEDVDVPTAELAQRRREVISVALSGNLPERELRALSERVRDDLLKHRTITQVDIESARPWELAVEISERRLREYGLTLADVAQAISRGSASASAGNLRTEGGELLLRTQGQAYTAREFGAIPVVTRPDGSRLLVRDIATLEDGFDESPIKTRMNGRRAMVVEVYRVGDQSALEVARLTREYVDEARLWLPEAVAIDTWRDRSVVLKARLNTLLWNAAQGGVLVILLLSLFLRPTVAFWVTLGIPVSFLGSFIVLPWLGITINLISLFAFIVVLGIVVDDAIVTGESIYTRARDGVPGERAAVEGTLAVATPVTFGVLTTALAFIPLSMVGGVRGQIFAQIPAVVVPVLLFSLIESKFVLPAHLKHLRPRGEDRPGPITRVQRAVADGLEQLVAHVYEPVLRVCLRWHLSTVALFLAVFMVAVAVMSSGWIRFVFFPRVQSETATASLQMPAGTPFAVTDRIITDMAEAAATLREQHRLPDGDQSAVLNILATTGSSGGAGAGAGHLGRVRVEVLAPEKREALGMRVTTNELVREWRRLIGPVPGAESLSFRAEIGRGGDPVDVQLIGRDLNQLREVSTLTREHLGTYEGLFDIADSLSSGKRELELRLRPGAQALGLSVSDLAAQVRQGFYGHEVQRIQRDRDEVKVVVRYPAEERASLRALQSIRIRTADGQAVPFGEVAEIVSARGPSTLYRIDRQRTVNITADADKKTVDMEAVKRGLRSWLDELLAAYPGVSYTLEGEAAEQRESMTTLQYGILGVLLGIYALLAIPFRSYTQPFVVMSVIPFGLVGALLGHGIMGIDLSIMSLMGMLALSGVVVNDSLVLVDYVNGRRRDGVPLIEAVRTAGRARFRPVLLTSLTTFIGLMPLLFDDSTQVQFLIPMAVSLGFGILFATLITLVLVPCVYVIGAQIGEQIQRGWALMLGADRPGQWRAPEQESSS